MDNSISQSSNWPEQNIETGAIVAAAMGESSSGEEKDEDEQEMGFESFHPMENLQGWNSDYANVVEAGPEEETGVEPPVADNSDLFQSYPATILEGQDQIGEVEVDDLDKGGVDDNLWMVGDRCVARWEEEQGGDGLWYRARVGQGFELCHPLHYFHR